MEDVEKIYCCDRGNNNDALLASIIANNNRNCGMGDWMNNPLAYLLFFALFGRDGFGGANGAAAVAGRQGEELQTQVNSIRNQLQDNQNTDCIKAAIAGNTTAISQLANTLGLDVSSIKDAICAVQSAIQQTAAQNGISIEQVKNAIERGNSGLLAAIKDCCCQTQQAVLKMGYENQLGQKDIINTIQTGFDRTNTGLERGFAQIGYQNSQDKCDIVRAIENGNQGIKDLLNSHWKEEDSRKIQSLEFQLSQKDQNEKFAQMIAQVKGCGCGNGCGCNNNGCGCGCGC